MAQEEVQTLQCQIACKEEQLVTLWRESRVSAKTIKKLQGDVQRHEEQYDALTSELSERNGRISALNGEISDFQKKFRSQGSEVSEVAQGQRNSQAEEELRIVREELATARAASGQTRDEERKRMEAASVDASRLQKLNVRMEVEMEQLGSRLKEADARMEAASNHGVDLRAEATALEKRLRASREEVSKHAAEAVAWRDEGKVASAEVAELTERLNSATKGEDAGATAEIAELTERFNVAKREASFALKGNSPYASTSTKPEKMVEEIAALESACEERSERMQEQDQLMATLHRECAISDGRLARVEADYNSALQEINKLREQLSQTTSVEAKYNDALKENKKLREQLSQTMATGPQDRKMQNASIDTQGPPYTPRTDDGSIDSSIEISSLSGSAQAKRANALKELQKLREDFNIHKKSAVVERLGSTPSQDNQSKVVGTTPERKILDSRTAKDASTNVDESVLPRVGATPERKILDSRTAKDASTNTDESVLPRWVINLDGTKEASIQASVSLRDASVLTNVNNLHSVESQRLLAGPRTEVGQSIEVQKVVPAPRKEVGQSIEIQKTPQLHTAGQSTEVQKVVPAEAAPRKEFGQSTEIQKTPELHTTASNNGRVREPRLQWNLSNGKEETAHGQDIENAQGGDEESDTGALWGQLYEMQRRMEHASNPNNEDAEHTGFDSLAPKGSCPQSGSDDEPDVPESSGTPKPNDRISTLESEILKLEMECAAQALNKLENEALTKLENATESGAQSNVTLSPEKNHLRIDNRAGFGAPVVIPVVVSPYSSEPPSRVRSTPIEIANVGSASDPFSRAKVSHSPGASAGSVVHKPQASTSSVSRPRAAPTANEASSENVQESDDLGSLREAIQMSKAQALDSPQTEKRSLLFDTSPTLAQLSSGSVVEGLRELELRKTETAAERVQLREKSHRLIAEAQRLDEVLQEESGAQAGIAEQQVAELLEKRRETVSRDRSLSLILLDIERQISAGQKDLGSQAPLHSNLTSGAATPTSRLEKLQAEAMQAINDLRKGSASSPRSSFSSSAVGSRRVSFVDSS